jgi:type I restriction enzyme, S subunit
MIADLRPYPVMKDSGVPWLGEVPEHWEVRRNGRLFAQRNQTGFPDLPILEVSLRTGVHVRDFDTSNRKQVMSDREKYKRACEGDITYNMMRMWQGAVGVAPLDGLVSPAYVVAQPFLEASARYFQHVFRTDSYMNEVNRCSRGIVSDRNRLYWEDFKQISSPFPEPEEQTAIVRFLDHADRRIRRYIRIKQKLIKLLEEQKQAIIHRAVTRGLDPSVRLKPSGVEWLGDVPEHWEVIPLRRVTASRCDGPFGSGLKSAHYTDQGIRVVRLQNIGHAEFKDSDAAFISPSYYATLGDHTVEPGDLLVAGLGDERHPAGRACVAPSHIVPAMVKADCFRFRLLRQRLDPEFAALHMTATAADASSLLSTGATRQRTNLQATASRSIAIPPPREQLGIVRHIMTQTSSLRGAISHAQREIALLREYRTRLIADVVTGKLDVREAAARLPDESEDPEPVDTMEALVDGDEDAVTDLDATPEEAET